MLINNDTFLNDRKSLSLLQKEKKSVAEQTR